MTTATDLAGQWNDQIDEDGNAVTLYDPTIAYNDEGDVNSYTLDAGTSATVIYTEMPGGTSYESQVEGTDDRKSFVMFAKTTESIDEESLIKVGTKYYILVGGSLRKITMDDTVIAQRLTVRELLPQEAAKIA